MEWVCGGAICLSIKGRWEECSGKPFWKPSLVLHFCLVQILHNRNRDYRKEKKTTWINLQVFHLCVLTAGHETCVLPEKLFICSIALANSFFSGYVFSKPMKKQVKSDSLCILLIHKYKFNPVNLVRPLRTANQAAFWEITHPISSLSNMFTCRIDSKPNVSCVGFNQHTTWGQCFALMFSSFNEPLMP